MDVRFLPHNAHLDGAAAFEERDPQLRTLRAQPLVHTPALLARLPHRLPGIYTLGGGRQIGKTTLLKQWMAKLLRQGVAPTSIAFFTGELIDDHHALVHLVGDQLDEMPNDRLRYLLLDEVTYIREWDGGSNTWPMPASSNRPYSF
jgi:predicted AAA+ superfamily ATPase